MSVIPILLAAVVVCVLLSAFFSASEMAFSSANRVRVEHMAEQGSKKAKVTLLILDGFESALCAILFGNNLVNIAASSLASIAAIRIAGEKYTWAATLILTVVVIIAGETIPKILAQRHATRFSLALCHPIHFLMILLRPLTWLTVSVVKLFTRFIKEEKTETAEDAAEELHSIIETAEDEEVLDEETSELVSAAIDFSETLALDVMTARVDVEALSVDAEPEEIRRMVEESSHSRLPVYDDGLDNIIGVLHVNHYLKAVTGGEHLESIRPLLMPVTYVYKAMKLPAVLKTLQEKQQQLAVVTDEYGGTLGVVTLEDVLEELVGEIWDETDTVEQEITLREDGLYVLDGGLLLSDFAEQIGWKEDSLDFESDTVGGWCIEMLGHFPEKGEQFTYRDVLFTVTQIGERRVHEVQARAEG